MTKWEYQVAPVLNHVAAQILNNFGQDGWELVTLIPGQGGNDKFFAADSLQTQSLFLQVDRCGDIQREFGLDRAELALLSASYGMSFSGLLLLVLVFGALVLVVEPMRAQAADEADRTA